MSILRNKHTRLQFAYLIAFSLYFLQGPLYEHGGVIARCSLLFVLLVNLSYCYFYLKKGPSNSFLNSVLTFTIVITVYWLFSPKTLDLGDVVYSSNGELKNIFIFLWTFFPFYYWATRDKLDSNFCIAFAYVMIATFIIAFFIKQAETLQAEFWKDNVTNNGGYFLPIVVPLIGLIKKKRLCLVVLAVSIILTLISAKRGAILCIGVETLLFLWLQFKEIKKHFKSIVILLIIICVCGYYIYDFITANDFLLSRFSSDSSGRDDLYSNSIKIFNEGDLFHKLFGYGFLQTIPLISMFAHSDWFELLVDTGLFGIALYVIMFVSLLLLYYKHSNELPINGKFMFLSAISCWLIKSFFSMGFNAPEAAMLSAAIAISLFPHITNKIK